MELDIKVEKEELSEKLEKFEVVATKLRTSRIKAKQVAIFEFLRLMEGIEVQFIRNGPLSHVKGMSSFFVSRESLQDVVKRLKFLGYSDRFYLLDFGTQISKNETDIKDVDYLKWKDNNFSLQNLYQQDRDMYYEQSPHNRPFKIISYKGTVKNVLGYRGDGSELGRRALPVEDARCLVNLAKPFEIKTVLEPFAGGGGIVHACKYINPKIRITTIDIDKAVRLGLKGYGAKHYVGDSSEIILKGKFDAIITEVPFSIKAIPIIKKSFSNLYKNLNDRGCIVLMCSSEQSPLIKSHLSQFLKCSLLFCKDVNRKGTPVNIQVWTKSVEDFEKYEDLMDNLYKIF